MKFLKKDLQGFERVVYAEVVIPDTINTEGDYHTEQSVRDFAYGFMLVDHYKNADHEPITPFFTDKFTIVESFIVREGDKDFIKGAWVVGVMVHDDDLWQRILDGDINGFSYEADVYMLESEIQIAQQSVIAGITEPDINDGHKHSFLVFLDEDDRPVYGSTSMVDGHTHSISTHTYTDETENHTHRYNYVRGLND